jgi:hypothetical protein
MGSDWDERLDIQRDKRRLAVENNNQAWELIESSPNYLHAGELLPRAYASHRYWFEVGGPLEKQRAEHLVATAVCFLGITSLAVHHADACIKWSDANGDEQTAFDRAAALECLARSHACAGLADAANRRETARRAGELIEDTEERTLFERLLDSGPWFGLD